MKLFTIEDKKCRRDGICAEECPMGIIVHADKESVPTPAPDAEELCVHCGHCVAVCPHGAFSHSDMSPEQCPPVLKEKRLDGEHVEHFLRARRSIRVYKDEPVPKNILAKLIDIARYAPSGHNRQPVQWIVVAEPAKVQHLTAHVADWMKFMTTAQPQTAKSHHMDRILKAWESGVDVITRKAPHLIIAHAPKSDPTAPIACTIALTWIELATTGFGLGACWAGYFNFALMSWQPLQKAVGLPEGHANFGAMMVGYPKYPYYRMPLRNEPKILWR